MTTPIARGAGASVVLRDGRSSFCGLQSCGSVWECPHCAAKVSERKRAELLGAVAAHKAAGGTVLLLTLTVPHRACHGLRALRKRVNDARRRFKNRPGWKAVRLRLNLKGEVCARELTWSTENGWHLHTHELLFIEGFPDVSRLGRELLELWQSACLAAGLERPNEHGVDVRGGQFAARYAAKWGIEHELTKGHIKKVRRAGSYSPWDFLRELSETGDEVFCVLFNEYADEMKGVRQLTWSKGLRKALGLDDEKTDSEISSEAGAGGNVIGEIPRHSWRAVCVSDSRAEVLELSEAPAGWPGVVEFLERLVWKYDVCEFLVLRHSSEGARRLHKKQRSVCLREWQGHLKPFCS